MIKQVSERFQLFFIYRDFIVSAGGFVLKNVSFSDTRDMVFENRPGSDTIESRRNHERQIYRVGDL